MSGSIFVRIASQRGRCANGNTAPERKNIGITKNWITTWNDSTCSMRAASMRPIAVSMNATSIIMSNMVTISSSEYGTCTSPMSASMIAPWAVATVAPPSALPHTIAERRTGATSISRRKPNSRSHTIETAEKIAVNNRVIATTPGNRKVR